MYQLYAVFYFINCHRIGIHPFETKSWDESQMEELENILKEPECVAVGECGLDYTKDFSPRDVQRMVFERQVSIDYLF